MIVVRIQEEEPLISTRTVHRIRKYKVQLNGFKLTMSFCIDARRDPAKNKAIIDSQYNREVRVFGGSYKTDTYGFHKGWRKKSSAWYAINYTATSGLGAKRFWCKAHVNGQKVWPEISTP